MLEPDAAGPLTSECVRWLCDRHFGVGADGVLVPVAAPPGSDFALTIWNPDGGQAEKSGNGLRIFARWLLDHGRAGAEPFTVATQGGRVRCQLRANGALVFVEMGRARIDAVDETLVLPDGPVLVTAVDLGNPHCVVRCGEISPERVQRLGPQLEHHPRFAGRTNVQLVKVLARDRIQIEIWERGAGYTLASGSSACAASAAAVRWGACDGEVSVRMPGGSLTIGVGPDLELTMEGPAEKVFEGVVSPDRRGSDCTRSTARAAP